MYDYQYWNGTELSGRVRPSRLSYLRPLTTLVVAGLISWLFL